VFQVVHDFTHSTIKYATKEANEFDLYAHFVDAKASLLAELEDTMERYYNLIERIKRMSEEDV
jgi:hypothetical protein